MLVARIGCFEGMGAGADLHDEVDDIFQLHVVDARPEGHAITGMESDLYRYVGMASWQYISSRPIHNPGKFDLWIVVQTPRTNITVANW